MECEEVCVCGGRGEGAEREGRRGEGATCFTANVLLASLLEIKRVSFICILKIPSFIVTFVSK